MNPTTTTTTPPLPAIAKTNGVVLIADDLAPNRKMLEDTLKAVNYEVRTAKDGAEALQLCAEIEFDTVLLDVMMPHFTGYEVCAHLRSQPATEHIPVILVTALTGRNDRIQGVEAGANDFLIKPVDIQDVILRVRNSVRMKRLHDELRRNYQQLLESERLRDDLTHMVIHDMRNLLLGVSGNLQLLQMLAGSVLDAQQIRPVHAARKSTDSLQSMITSLLDISRIEGGQMPVEIGTHNLKELTVSAIAELGARTSYISIVNDIAPSTKTRCDRDLTGRVLQNLVANAMDFVPPQNGRIWLESAENEDGSIRISVSDNGIGIPEEFRTQIFEKFASGPRGGAAAKRPSAGLGLAFCKLAVEAHGGQIGVETGEGGGSRFWFALPSPLGLNAAVPELAAA